MLFDAICFGVSGFFMKFSDDAIDVKNNQILAIITDIICVIFIVLESLTNGDAACIFISILIGTVLAHKVDSINHIISAIILVVVLIVSHVPHFSWLCLIVCTIAAYIDERGHDEYDEYEENKMNNQSFDQTIFENFFKYRFALKIAVLAFSMLGLINIMLPSSPFIGWYFFSPMTFIYFYIFDLCYEIAGVSFDRIYNIF